ncbi:MAG: site-specific integrase, partial [Verrucomicrobia bacterium]|nr:site-specific integrase [Verrucomicrobiota bacterium]
MAHVRLHTAVFSTGERFPVLLDHETGQPVILPTRYVVDARREFRQTGTIAKQLRVIGWFYHWAQAQGIDPEQRLRFGPAFDYAEVLGFCRFLRAGRKDKVIASLADGPHVLRPNTFNAYLAELEAFLIWAMETQGLGGASEPARAAARTALRRLFRSQRLSALPSQKKYALSDEELTRLLAIVDPRSADNPFNAQTRHRNYLIIRLLLETGLRRGELCKLRLEDLMLHGGSPYLKVVRSPDDPHDPRRHEPQVKTLNRSVPVSRPCALALTVYVQKHRGRARHPYVFTSTRGGRPIWTGALNEVLEQVVSAHPPFASKLSPHGLRHTFATRLKNASQTSALSGPDFDRALNFIMGWTENSAQAAVYTRAYVETRADELVRVMHEGLRGLQGSP